jgi:hypothetical protein
MKKTFFAVLLAAALLAAGCKERDISGQVLEHGTEQPIEGATVTLSACSGELLGSTNCYRKATTTTDDEGRFGFGGEGTIVTAEAAGYWPSDDNFGFLNSDEHGYKPATLYLYPHAWLKVTFKNESEAYGFVCTQLLGYLEPINYQAQNEVSSVVKLVAGNKLYKLAFGVLADANTSIADPSTIKILSENGDLIPTNQGLSFSASFSVVGHDTTSITIIY